MKYRKLGDSDLVFKISLGSWLTYGVGVGPGTGVPR
jgi:hypothetical protein